MVPIGRGQRELVVGDRQTGKASVGVDTILNQKYENVFCSYCPIGQKASAVLEVFLCLIRRDAIANVSIIVASAATFGSHSVPLCIHWNCSNRVFMLVKESPCFVIFDSLSRTQSRTEKYTFSFVVLPVEKPTPEKFFRSLTLT